MNLLRELRCSNVWLRVLFIFILTWALLLCVFMSNTNLQPPKDQDGQKNLLDQVLQQLKQTKAREEELRLMIEALAGGHVETPNLEMFTKKFEYTNKSTLHGITGNVTEAGNITTKNVLSNNVPSIEYELVRRRIYTNIDEIWRYYSAELGKLYLNIAPEMLELEQEINGILQLGAEHKRSLLSDMNQLRQLDGHEAWREQESRDLSDLVQRRLRHLQNAKDCDNARKLICLINLPCSYACQLHHVTSCFIVAYATGRIMFLMSNGWKYHNGGWEEVFQSVSATCLKLEGINAEFWPAKRDTQVLLLPMLDLSPRPPFLPLAVPEDLAPRLKRLHGDPFVWWLGQFLMYLMRPQNKTKKFLETETTAYGWKKPIVGVHVRRADQIGIEEDFHNIEEYMTHVEDYFLTQEINGTTVSRRIFLATDDPNVIVEARTKYLHYEIIGSTKAAGLAGRKTVDSATLNGIILDIHLLSLSDYLVCTFSSQVCRVAYEIMQTLFPDAAHRFKSLDDIYFYAGQSPNYRQAVIAHVARNFDEIELKQGDLI